MKFIKESIEFPSSKNKVKECVHPLREEKRISRKWGHTWYFDDNYNVVKVRAKDGTVLRRGEPFEVESRGKLVINGFDPDTNTVYVVEADDYDPNFDGGADYAVEDIVKIFKYWDKQPIKDTDVKSPELTTSKRLENESLKEHTEESKIYRVTYDVGDNIYSAVMVKANSEEEAEKIFKSKLSRFSDSIIGIADEDDFDVALDKKRGMSILEDLDVDELEHEEAEEGSNPEPPVAGEESAAASLINSLIRDEWLAIEQYNSAMVNLKEYGVDEKIIEVLNHIMFDENTHVGNLQEVLALLAPATNKIEKGNEQAEQILNIEDEESEDN